MKKLFAILSLIICLVLGSTKESRADHIWGGDISYIQHGKDTFDVTVTIYRDCNGISIPSNNLLVNYPRTSSFSVSYSTTQSGGKDITPTCKNLCSRCGKTPNTNYGDPKCKFPYGIEMYYYKARVIIPKKTKYCQVYFSWESCCRSGTLTTGGNWEGFYIEAMAERCSTVLNNSPVFNSPPQVIVPTNNCMTIDGSAMDKDVNSKGRVDSLSYLIDSPLSALSTRIKYSSSYSYKHPFRFSGFGSTGKLIWAPPTKCEGFFIDSVTGEIHFKGTKVEQAAIAYRVEEYSWDTTGKPYLKGYIKRDVPLMFLDTKLNTVPTLSGIDGRKSRDTIFCSGTKQCFTINSFDINSSDSATVSSKLFTTPSGSVPVFTTETKKLRPRSTLCWTPTAGDIRPEPYILNLYVSDNVCPIPGTIFVPYHIRVVPGTDSFTSSVSANCGLATFIARPKHKGGKIGTLTWTGDSGLSAKGDSVTFRYPKAGTYRWRASSGSGGCQIIDSGSVTVKAPFSVAKTFSPRVCHSDTSAQKVSLSPSSYSGTVYYQWKNGPATSALSLHPKKDTTLYFSVIDSLSSTGGCRYSDSIRITKLDALYDSVSVPQTGCREISYSVNSRGLATTTYNWSGDDTLSGSSSFSVHNYPAAGRYFYKIIAQDGSCTQSDTGSVIIRDLSMKINGDTFACAADSSVITLSPSVKNASLSGVSYIWSDSSKLSNLTFKARKDTAFRLLIQDNATTCQKHDSIHIHVEPAGAKPLITYSGGWLSTPTKASKYQWYFIGGAIKGADSSSFQPMATGVYKVAALSARGCAMYSDTMSVIVTGLKESANAGSSSFAFSGLSIYPNPAGEVLHISWTTEIKGEITVRLRDLQGRVLHEERVSGSALLFDINLQRLRLASGQYQLELITAEGVRVEKLIGVR